MGVVAEGSDMPESRITPAAANRTPKHRRSLGSRFLRLFKRLWIALVIVAVVAAGGFAVSRLRAIFGSETLVPYGGARSDTKPVEPSYLTYEITGPPGTTAQISYFDADGNPQFLDAVSLPWTLEFPMSATVGVGSIAAQGDGDSISCRILVDGKEKAAKTVYHEASSFTSCLLKAA